MENEIMIAESKNQIAETGTANTLSFSERVALARAATNYESVWDVVRTGSKLNINATSLLFVPVSTVDDATGEVSGRTRTIFIDELGKAYATTSQAVENVATTLAEVVGTNFDEPIPMHFELGRSRGGNDFVALVIE